MELIIIPALTTIALFVLQAREYLSLRRLAWSAARFPSDAATATVPAAAPPVRRKLTPYVIKQEETSAERAA